MPETLCGCSLDPAELDQVVGRYRQAARHYAASASVEGDRAFIDLHGNKSSLAALLDEMMAREAVCCPQLFFSIDETAEGYRVTLSTREAPGRAAIERAEALPILFPTARSADEIRLA